MRRAWFPLPIPDGGTPEAREALLWRWVSAEVENRNYNRMVGAYGRDRGGVPDELVRQANATLVPIGFKLVEMRQLVTQAIIDRKAAGAWEPEWPQNAKELADYAMQYWDKISQGRGLGFAWAALIPLVLKVLSMAVVLAGLSVLLYQTGQLVQQLPEPEAFGEAAEAIGEGVKKSAAGLGLLLLGAAALWFLGRGN